MRNHAFATMILLIAVTSPVAADAPLEALKTRVDHAVQVLNDPQTRGPAHVQERRAQIRKIADQIFDFPEMAKRALAVHWKDVPPADRERFVRLFSDLLDRAYFEKIDSYNGEKVTYLTPKAEGDTTTVSTRVGTDKGTEVPVDYKMMREGDRWMVYDVIIEGVSLVQNYRAQFDRVIRTTSFDDLLKRMESQVAGQASPGGPKPRGGGRG